MPTIFYSNPNPGPNPAPNTNPHLILLALDSSHVHENGLGHTPTPLIVGWQLLPPALLRGVPFVVDPSWLLLSSLILADRVLSWWWWWWWLSTCIAHYAERLYCATCPGVLWKGMSSELIEKIRCWAMDHGDDQAAGSRPSDLPRRIPDVRTWWYVVRSADGEWQIGDADDWQCLM